MNAREWRQHRDNRSMRYAGRVLDSRKWIHLSIDSRYASRYDGQVAILTAANLLGRMTPSVALEVPSTPLVDRLSWIGTDLREVTLEQLHKSDPYGGFSHRAPTNDDYIIHLAKSGADNVVHGIGLEYLRWSSSFTFG